MENYKKFTTVTEINDFLDECVVVNKNALRHNQIFSKTVVNVFTKFMKDKLKENNIDVYDTCPTEFNTTNLKFLNKKDIYNLMFETNNIFENTTEEIK